MTRSGAGREMAECRCQKQPVRAMSAVTIRSRVGSRGTTTAEWRAAARAEATYDAELVRRCKVANDEDAFTEIVHRHHNRIFSLVLGSVHNRADAEEIASDTFARAHRGLKNFRGDSSLATWLHHIAVNLARNRYWYLYRRRHVSTSLDTPLAPNSPATLADVVPSDAPDPSQCAADVEFATIIRTCLTRLPPRQREILEMRGVFNRSYEEIAAAIGINVGTVKSRIARARLMLRKQVRESLPDCESKVA